MEALKNKLRKSGITKKTILKYINKLRYLRQTLKLNETIYLVYTMGKVGSTTIQETLDTYLKVGDVFHVHYLSDKGTEHLEKLGFTEASKKVEIIKNIINNKTAVKIITVTRDPIAKKISGLFQNPWIYGLDEESLTQLTAQEVCEIINQNLDKFWDSLTWFDEEFFDYTGIDVYSKSFDFNQRKENISQGNIDVLVLRLEDFKETETITAHLQDFIGEPIKELINGNQTQNKQSKELYKKTIDMIQFPEDFLKQIYGSKYCNHFYTPTEINKFWSKWMKSKNLGEVK